MSLQCVYQQQSPYFYLKRVQTHRLRRRTKKKKKPHLFIPTFFLMERWVYTKWEMRGLFFTLHLCRKLRSKLSLIFNITVYSINLILHLRLPQSSLHVLTWAVKRTTTTSGFVREEDPFKIPNRLKYGFTHLRLLIRFVPLCRFVSCLRTRTHKSRDV